MRRKQAYLLDTFYAYSVYLNSRATTRDNSSYMSISRCFLGLSLLGWSWWRWRASGSLELLLLLVDLLMEQGLLPSPIGNMLTSALDLSSLDKSVSTPGMHNNWCGCPPTTNWSGQCLTKCVWLWGCGAMCLPSSSTFNALVAQL